VISGSKFFAIVFSGNPRTKFSHARKWKIDFQSVRQALLAKRAQVSGAAKLQPSKTTGLTQTAPAKYGRAKSVLALSAIATRL